MTTDETADAALGIGPQDSLVLGGPFEPELQKLSVPVPDAHPSQWLVFLDYQLEQPQSVEAWKRLRLAQDVLRRWLMTAAQFQEWWQNNGD